MISDRKIHVATHDDCDVISKLDLQAFGRDNYPLSYFVQAIEIFGNGYTAAEVDGETVGFCIAATASDQPSTGWILTVVVAPDHQHKGIGTLLIDSAVIYLRARGLNKILLSVAPTNQHAIVFYENRGFKKLEFRKNYFGANEHRLIYELKLAP